MNKIGYKEIKKLDCDALVIGSGAGGAIVANELAKAGRDVLLVEEGHHIKYTNVPSRLSQSFSSMWRNGGLSLARGRSTSVAFAEGCCVGGGTEINSAIFQQIDPELFEKWLKKYEIKDFSWQELLGYYLRASKLVNSQFTNGELGEHSNTLKKIGEIKGWQTSPLQRGHKGCVGTNHCSVGCPTGAKQSMSNTVIEDFLKNGGRLISNCKINKIVLDGCVASYVLGEINTKDNKSKKVTILPRHVFVCGGATQTPAILRRSGIKKAIGDGFSLHPTVRVLAEFENEINAHKSRLPLYAITEFSPNRRIGGSVFSLPTFGMFLAEDWENRRHLQSAYSNMTLYYAMARGTGKGFVRSIPFTSHAKITYTLSQNDWFEIETGLADLCVALFESGATRVQASIQGQKPWSSIHEFKKSIEIGIPRKSYNLMSIHLFGSVGLGEDQEICGADSYGKLHGFSNIYVADASIIPEATGVNPQATVMAFAMRVANSFIQKN